jgi:hypothetical protein
LSGAPTTFAPDKAFLGIAPESTPGTAVAPTFTFAFDKFDPEDKPKMLDDPSLVGSMVTLHNRQLGVIVADWSLDAPMYPDVLPFLIENIMGDVTHTGSSAPYTHAASTKNSGNGQPKSHTWTHYQGITATSGARQYASSCLSDLSIKFDAAAALCKITAKGMSWSSAPATSAPTSAPSAENPVASWRGVVGIGGTAVGAPALNIQTLELDIKRKLEAHFTLQNAQNPYVIQRGAISVSGKMTVVAADESPQVALLAGTQQQMQLILANGGSGAAARSLQIDGNQMSYKAVKLDQSKTATLYGVEFDLIANSTNAGASGGISPAKLTVVNGNAGTVY